MGIVTGIARHARPRGPMEVLDHVGVTVEAGLDGDFRGAVKPGGRGRRQVSLIERRDWDAAMADLGVDHHWSARRANLLVEGAYTQSRFRQMIFGGATSHILANAELPVLMAH